MTLIMCEIHGNQSIIHACEHVSTQYFDKQHLIQYYEIKDLSGMIFYLCENCIKKYNINIDKALDFEELMNIDDELTPICEKCFGCYHLNSIKHE